MPQGKLDVHQGNTSAQEGHGVGVPELMRVQSGQAAGRPDDPHAVAGLPGAQRPAGPAERRHDPGPCALAQGVEALQGVPRKRHDPVLPAFAVAHGEPRPGGVQVAPGHGARFRDPQTRIEH